MTIEEIRTEQDPKVLHAYASAYLLPAIRLWPDGQAKDVARRQYATLLNRMSELFVCSLGLGIEETPLARTLGGSN